MSIAYGYNSSTKCFFLNGAIVSGKSWHMISYIMIDISDGFVYDNNTRKRRISLLQIICYWGGAGMATTSITKEFFIKDQKAFEHMKRDLDKEVPVHKMVAESASLKKSKEKLATFVFR